MYLGIDYGKKRIGLAIGEILPKGFGVLDGGLGTEIIADKIKTICDENEVDTIIVGTPIRSNNEPGTLAGEIDEFVIAVKNKTGRTVVLESEAFTSSEAEKILNEGNVKYTREGGEIDEMAAVLILEQYINTKK